MKFIITINSLLIVFELITGIASDKASDSLESSEYSNGRLSDVFFPSRLPICRDDEIFSEEHSVCLKRSWIFDKCEIDVQCIVPDTRCINKICLCSEPYLVESSGKNKCNPIHNADTAIEIYKITMIFASSCLALILLIFLACILRKSYCPPASSLQSNGRGNIPDLFTIYPGTSGAHNDLFSIPPGEKPPSYSETMRMINQEIGTPPPAYHNILFYSDLSSVGPINPPSAPSNSQPSNSQDAVAVRLDVRSPPQPSSPSTSSTENRGQTNIAFSCDS